MPQGNVFEYQLRMQEELLNVGWICVMRQNVVSTHP